MILLLWLTFVNEAQDSCVVVEGHGRFLYKSIAKVKLPLIKFCIKFDD